MISITHYVDIITGFWYIACGLFCVHYFLKSIAGTKVGLDQFREISKSHLDYFLKSYEERTKEEIERTKKNIIAIERLIDGENPTTIANELRNNLQEWRQVIQAHQHTLDEVLKIVEERARVRSTTIDIHNKGIFKIRFILVLACALIAGVLLYRFIEIMPLGYSRPIIVSTCFLGLIFIVDKVTDLFTWWYKYKLRKE